MAYGIFGTSRQLIVGPDAATCALVAASVAPLAAGDQATYASLSMVLALLRASVHRRKLPAVGCARRFSIPANLVGFLNGVALSIILGQADKIFGFPVTESGILPRLAEIAGKLDAVQWPTLSVAVGTFLVLLIVPRLVPQLPAALVGMVLAGAAVLLLNLPVLGVKTIGHVPAGLPELELPRVSPKAAADPSGRGGRFGPCQLLKPDADGTELCREKRL